MLRSIWPSMAVRGLWCHRRLILQFAIREVEGRYRGSVLGILWSFLTPLVMLGMYTFVFGVVFRARWPGQQSDGSLTGFALVLFAGTTVFNLFSETVGRSPSLITGVPGYVKKVIFPLEILPLSLLGASMFHALVSLALLLIAGLVVNGVVPWTASFAPLILLPLVLLTAGVSWFLASLGVYLRDVGNLVGVVLQVLFFATPIFYPVSALPAALQGVISWNPLTPPVQMLRDACLFGVAPDPAVLGLSLVVGMVMAWLGYAWFTLTRRGFADVL